MYRLSSGMVPGRLFRPVDHPTYRARAKYVQMTVSALRTGKAVLADGAAPGRVSKLTSKITPYHC